jgi:hypothetical protein
MEPAQLDDKTRTLSSDIPLRYVERLLELGHADVVFGRVEEAVELLRQPKPKLVSKDDGTEAHS